MSEDLILMPEVLARRALHGHPVRLQLLAPYGNWIGRGTLRVLRLKVQSDGCADLTVGYESYELLR